MPLSTRLGKGTLQEFGHLFLKHRMLECLLMQIPLAKMKTKVLPFHTLSDCHTSGDTIWEAPRLDSIFILLRKEGQG